MKNTKKVRIAALIVLGIVSFVHVGRASEREPRQTEIFTHQLSRPAQLKSLGHENKAHEIIEEKIQINSDRVQ